MLHYNIGLVCGTGLTCRLCHPAALFAGPAGNVMIFFKDLMGMTEIYNRSGIIISIDNWSLKITNDFACNYREQLACNQAINLLKALALALRSRGRTFAENHHCLLKRLGRLAGNPPRQEHWGGAPNLTAFLDWQPS